MGRSRSSTAVPPSVLIAYGEDNAKAVERCRMAVIPTAPRAGGVSATEGSGMMKPGVVGQAIKDDRCRWSLTRTWDLTKGYVLFVGLNPNKVGADVDDMTVTKGMGFARLWGFGGTLHGNAYPFIATRPADLVQCTEEEIAKNDEALLMMAQSAALVVLAWIVPEVQATLLGGRPLARALQPGLRGPDEGRIPTAYLPDRLRHPAGAVVMKVIRAIGVTCDEAKHWNVFTNQGEARDWATQQSAVFPQCKPHRIVHMVSLDSLLMGLRKAMKEHGCKGDGECAGGRRT